MKNGKEPNPNTVHPIAGYEKEIYVKPAITNPNILVGDFTYIADSEFESHVTNFYPWSRDKLIIGKFCQIELVAERMMNEPVRIKITPEDIEQENGKVVHSFIKVDERDKTDLLRRLANLEDVQGLAFVNNIDQLVMKENKLKFRDAKIVSKHIFSLLKRLIKSL